MTKRKPAQSATLAVRALRTTQGAGVDVYALFLRGADLLKVAEISRVHRDAEGKLQGFQRKEIKNHVQSIVDFLNKGKVLFPNAIILAISPKAIFTRIAVEHQRETLRLRRPERCEFQCPVMGRKRHGS